MSGILGWFSGQPVETNQSNNITEPPAQVAKTPPVHVPPTNVTGKNAKKRAAKEAEKKANEQAKQLQKAEKKSKKEARIESKELNNKFEILRTPLSHANAQEAQEKVTAVNDRLIKELGLFVCVRSEKVESARNDESKTEDSEKTVLTEKSWADSLASFKKYIDEFEEKRAAVIKYGTTLQGLRLQSEALKEALKKEPVPALIDQRQQVVFTIADELEKYETIHFPFGADTLKRQTEIANQRKTINEKIEGHLALLSRLEEALNEYYKKNQHELLSLENTLDSKRNPLEHVVNVPTGENTQSSAYITPTNTVALNIFSASDMTKRKDAITYIATRYSRHEKEIDEFVSQFIGQSLLKKSPEDAKNYDKTNFSQLFNCVELLKKECDSLLTKLNGFLGQIANSKIQLTPSIIPDEKQVKENAHKTKMQYEELFKEGELVLKKIHSRKKELEAMQIYFNKKLDRMSKIINIKEAMLHTDFSTIVNECSFAMDEIRSKRWTVSSLLGAYTGKQRGFFHYKQSLISMSVEYQKHLGIVKETRRKLEEENAAKAKEKEAQDKISAAGVGMDEAVKKAN